MFLVLDELARRSVDLGFKRGTTAQQVQRRLCALLEGRWWQGEVSSVGALRVFHAPGRWRQLITPHTDNPDKIIAMVVPMAEPGGGANVVSRGF